MNGIRRSLMPVLITLTLFSYWAAFALLIVNKIFFKDLPGYVIGRICIWEVVMLAVSGFIANVIISNWVNIEYGEIDGQQMIILNPKYGVYFGIYFLIATLVGIWQFWLFSQNF